VAFGVKHRISVLYSGVPFSFESFVSAQIWPLLIALLFGLAFGIVFVAIPARVVTFLEWFPSGQGDSRYREPPTSSSVRTLGISLLILCPLLLVIYFTVIGMAG
jgi:hypothetical protein